MDEVQQNTGEATETEQISQAATGDPAADAGAAAATGVEGEQNAAPSPDAASGEEDHPAVSVLNSIEEKIKGLSEAVHREVEHLFEEARSLL